MPPASSPPRLDAIPVVAVLVSAAPHHAFQERSPSRSCRTIAPYGALFPLDSFLNTPTGGSADAKLTRPKAAMSWHRGPSRTGTIARSTYLLLVVRSNSRQMRTLIRRSDS